MYNWVILDLELSLFHDTPPLLSISELECPLPSPKLLWMAPDAEQWRAGIQSIYGCTTNVNPHLLSTSSLTPSLFDLFQKFLHGNLTNCQDSLEPQQMRLLLHPLQSLLCHLRQTLSCFSDILGGRRSKCRIVTKASTSQRVEEVQGLLGKWFELASAQHEADPACAVTQCNLILYHLISVNAVTSFLEVERLARMEGFEGSGGGRAPTYWELGLRHKRCIHQRERAIFHCGQALRLLRALPTDRQPSWWGAAVYRVTMVLWTDGLARLDPQFKTPAASSSSTKSPEITPGATVTTSSRIMMNCNILFGRSSSSNNNNNNNKDDDSNNDNKSSSHSSTAGSPPSSSTTLPSPSMSTTSNDAGVRTPTPAMGMPSPSPSQSQSPSLLRASCRKLAVDQVAPTDASVITYLWGGDGTVVLTRADGTAVGLDEPAKVLELGIEALAAGVSTRIGDGLKRKLTALAARWNFYPVAVATSAAG